jgi:hypothetical protein
MAESMSAIRVRGSGAPRAVAETDCAAGQQADSRCGGSALARVRTAGRVEVAGNSARHIWPGVSVHDHQVIADRLAAFIGTLPLRW